MAVTTLLSASEVVSRAAKAHDLAARKQFEAEGSKDYGSCGGYMIRLDGRGSIAAAAVKLGYAYKSGNGVYVAGRLPEGVCTQSANVIQAAGRAFTASLRADGAGGSIAQEWPYVD